VRITTLAVAVVVVVWFGPSAAHVLQTRLGGRPAQARHTSRGDDGASAGGARTAGQGQIVELGRVGFRLAPPWATKAVLPVILADLEPRLRAPDGSDDVALLDQEGVDAVLAAIRASPWVAAADMEREFPDRLALSLQIRRPVIEVRDEQGEPRFALDRKGTCLPPVPAADLPFTVLRGIWDDVARDPVPGRVHPDPRALAALDVALTWRDEVAPELGEGAPPLVEIDAFNLLGRRLRGARHPEIRVILRRADGGLTSLAWGRPSTTTKSTVPTATKVEVLQQILARHPGLGELTGGDLRFANLWDTWLLPRTGPDPVPEGF